MTPFTPDLVRLRERLDMLGRRLVGLNSEVDALSGAVPEALTPREVENRQKTYQNLVTERTSIERELARIEGIVDESIPRWIRPFLGLLAKLRRS